MAVSVVIGGGGIAGLALGIRLRQAGHSPVVIERQERKAGVKLPIKGEYFQPQGVALLKKLGLLEGLLAAGAAPVRTVSHTFRTPFGFRAKVRKFTCQYNDHDGIDFGLAIRHEEIVDFLRTRYLELGGTLRENIAVKALVDEGAQCRVALSNGETLVADFFVGADGRHSVSRKAAGIPVVEFPCERFMMAALLENAELAAGEFYTEEIPGGVFYAFRFKDGATRGYVCFEKPDFAEANGDRSGFFLAKLRQTSLPGLESVRLIGNAMIMPTADTMMIHARRGRAIWMGDAAGTVDPLGGHGMSIALQDAWRIGEALLGFFDESRALTASVREIDVSLRRVARESRHDYLHGRFLAIWIALLFMGTASWNRWAKWLAIRAYERDATLRSHLVDLFGGMNKEPFGIYDLPYLLGLLPSGIRERIHRAGLVKMLRSPQNHVLTVPRELDRQKIQDSIRSARLFERVGAQVDDAIEAWRT